MLTKYILIACLSCALFLACGEDEDSTTGSGGTEAGVTAGTDAGTDDAGTDDAGTSDAGTDDAGTDDAGTDDAGTDDAGTDDAGTDDAGTDDVKNIVEIASTTDGFSTLVAAVEAAGAVELLSGEGPFTVFAPTDDAFADLGDAVGELVALAEEGDDTLLNILSLHVLAAKVLSTDLEDGLTASTINDMELIVGITDGIVTIDAGGSVATVITADIEASNGVIHVIDTVLLPAEEEELPNIVELAGGVDGFETLLAAADAAGAVELLTGEGPFTVFAPTDEAFAALGDVVGELVASAEEGDGTLLDILSLHILAGKVLSTDLEDGLTATSINDLELIVGITDGIVTIDSGGSVATVVIPDIEASNGVVHVIDKVLLPPTEDDELNIVETAIATDGFNTLVAAVQAAGAVELLSGEGPFTVFAPTDEAFAELGELVGELVASAEEGDGTLLDILSLHVLAAQVLSTDLEDGLVAVTLNEAELLVGIMDGIVTIDSGGSVATVILPDVTATNGVIHVIDTVLLPPTR
jgi:transforming growth factor-beta-induced protein